MVVRPPNTDYSMLSITFTSGRNRINLTMSMTKEQTQEIYVHNF